MPGYKKGEVRTESVAKLLGWRDYLLFGLLTNGHVRISDAAGYAPNPRGLPDVLGYESQRKALLFVYDGADDDSESSASTEKAKQWTTARSWGTSSQWVDAGYGTPLEYYDPEKHGPLDDNGLPPKRFASHITHPDWHTHSWLTADELQRVVDVYPTAYDHVWGASGVKIDGPASPQHEVFGWLGMLRALEARESVLAARLVFWFDN